MALDRNYIRSILEQKLAQRRQRILVWILAVASVVFFMWAFYAIYLKAPVQFPIKSIINIEENSGLNQVTQTLYDNKIIRSPFWFRMAVILSVGQKGAMAGDYYFEKPVGVFNVAVRLTAGNFGLTPARLTFPEGMTAAQMATVLESSLINFDTKNFLLLTKLNEGYFFPDTYLFMPNVKPEQVIAVLRDNFNKKIIGIDSQIKTFKKPLKDVVTMASIIEAEARTQETRKIVAGILWKRLAIGMPLQVDAPFQYIIGKNTFQLTTDDLKFKSPYNTYLHTGLPPTPINNPGLDALIDTVNPIKTEYLYYLSDVRGNMHYAKTYAEHLLNKEKYLR